MNSIQPERTEHVAQAEITAESPGIQEGLYKLILWGMEGGTAEEVHHRIKAAGSKDAAC